MGSVNGNGEKTACGLPRGVPFAIEQLLVIIEPRSARLVFSLRIGDRVDTHESTSTHGGIDATLKAIDTLVERHAAPRFARFESSSINSDDVRMGSSSDASVVVRAVDLATGATVFGTFVWPDSVVATAQAYVRALNEIYARHR